MKYKLVKWILNFNIVMCLSIRKYCLVLLNKGMHQKVFEQIDHLKTLYSAFKQEVLCTYEWADWPSESTIVLVNWQMHQGALCSTYEWADWPSENTIVFVNWKYYVLIEEQIGRLRAQWCL